MSCVSPRGSGVDGAIGVFIFGFRSTHVDGEAGRATLPRIIPTTLRGQTAAITNQQLWAKEPSLADR